MTDYKGTFLVIFFYASDYENEHELRVLNNNFKQFKKNSCEVVACSTDSTMIHSKWIQSIKVIEEFLEIRFILNLIRRKKMKTFSFRL